MLALCLMLSGTHYAPNYAGLEGDIFLKYPWTNAYTVKCDAI